MTSVDRTAYDEYALHRRPAEFADRYIGWWHRRMYDHAGRWIHHLDDRSLLEVGVGHGYFARAARPGGHRYSGLEMNPLLAAQLREEGYRVREATVPPFPADVGPVEVMWISEVLEHMNDWRQARELMAGAFDAVEPGGYVCVIVPDISSYKWEFWGGDWTHGYPTSPRRCEQLARDVGLEIVRCETHVCGVFAPVRRALLGWAMRVFPYRLIDAVSSRTMGGKSFGYSFMTVFGWRQVFLLGRRPAESSRSDW